MSSSDIRDNDGPSGVIASIPDPIAEGLARGWKVRGGPHGALPERIDCDVAIIGSGAGAGITAEMLARAGLQVLIIEEGPLKSSRDFRQRESDAYTQLYQEGGGRKTADQAIPVLQGRCVGGSTTVNWAGSFRTPAETLAFWGERFGLSTLNFDAMQPWFEQVEKRLNISPWLTEPNANNQVLRRGLEKVGVPAPTINRNVKGCWNLGSCGLGCPTNAKQSMLVTTIPAALDLGATLLVQTRAERFELQSKLGNSDEREAEALICQPIQTDGSPAGAPLRVRAKHFVVAGGAINSPALLLRSDAPDPFNLLGRRTFLHPTVASCSVMPEVVNGWAGAPLAVYSDHFLSTQAMDGVIGYKLETAPVHPGLVLTNLGGIGSKLAERARALPQTAVLIGLLRDGFHPDSIGGSVKLRRDGSPALDYPVNAYLLEGARRAHLTMAEVQFAAGARSVHPVHELAQDYRSWAEAKAAIQALPYKPFITGFASAHVMGGCGMAADAARGVVRPDGQHWQLRNVSVHDGSTFPTSIGANPQMTVYSQAARMTAGLARRLNGREVRLFSPSQS
ncbi:GMC family oxidoreductase [Kinneretia aquatilis]|uniref:GMC family oxidoreductase n=1 Tax=Kinneretia aquatilis TaxID=2070761 RepID=UPI0014953C96|nr:GMC family oxidoreductase [Paucibacter aquatile]WIV98993.1 GMC family oxidoreductase [Paucibacter aquatile]